MEPENHPLEVRQAFEKVVTPMKLALIGDAPYAHDYIRRVRDTEDPRIVMPGAIYGAGLSRAGLALLRLHSRHRSGRHASGADRSHGPRRAGALSQHAGECRGRAGDAGIPFEPETLVAKMRALLAGAGAGGGGRPRPGGGRGRPPGGGGRMDMKSSEIDRGGRERKGGARRESRFGVNRGGRGGGTKKSSPPLSGRSRTPTGSQGGPLAWSTPQNKRKWSKEGGKGAQRGGGAVVAGPGGGRSPNQPGRWT